MSTHPLSTDPVAGLVDLFNEFPWDSAQGALQAFGWATLAPLCHALCQRPHIFLTGPMGSGKTTFLQHLKMLMPKPLLFLNEAPSADAVEHLLRPIALPVLCDDATNAGGVQALIRSRAMCCFAAVEAPLDLASHPRVLPLRFRFQPDAALKATVNP